MPEVTLFPGFELERLAYLVALCFSFLFFVVVNGWLKQLVNTEKGRLGERMLRRMRYELYDRVLRFPIGHFRKVKQAEVATMIKDEVEPLGGFIGDAYVTPAFLGGQALTALYFIFLQDWRLGIVSVVVLDGADHRDPAAAPAHPGAGPAAPDHRAPAGRAHRGECRRHGRDPFQRHLELRARRHRQPAGSHLPDPLRAVSAQVLRQIPEQPAVADHAVPVLPDRRLPDADRPFRRRLADRGDRRLQGSAEPDQGTDRLGPAAPAGADQLRPGDRAVHARRHARPEDLQR